MAAGSSSGKRAGPEQLRVEKRSLAAQATEVIREQILNGTLGSGSRITEAALAEQLGLSRGTIRTALHDLTHEGLVCAEPYARWTVAEFTVRDAWELCRVRVALEGLAARCAAEEMTPEKAEILDAAFERLAKAARSGKRARVIEADFNLHKTILELAGNRRLIELFARIEVPVRVYIALSDARLVDLHDAIQWHEPMVRAVRSGDPEAAQRVAEEDSRRNGEELIRNLEARHVELDGGRAAIHGKEERA